MEFARLPQVCSLKRKMGISVSCSSIICNKANDELPESILSSSSSAVYSMLWQRNRLFSLSYIERTSLRLFFRKWIENEYFYNEIRG